MGYAHRITRQTLFLCWFCFSVAACAHAGGSGQDGVSDMIQDRIAAMSILVGDAYLAERKAFLAEVAELPDYPHSVDEADPRYRVQYLILKGWQQNGALYQSLQKELSEVNTTFMSASASGFNPLYNDFRMRSETEWKADGLPFAWEMVQKFHKDVPRWQINVAYNIIDGYPDGGSVDALLVAMAVPNTEAFVAQARFSLGQMPGKALVERQESNQPFYIAMRSELAAAAKGR